MQNLRHSQHRRVAATDEVVKQSDNRARFGCCLCPRRRGREGGGESGGNGGGGGAEIDFSGQFFEDRVSRRRCSTDATAAPPRLAGRGRSAGVGLGLAVDRGSCSKGGQITCLWGECTCRRKARPSQGTGHATILNELVKNLYKTLKMKVVQRFNLI